MNKLRWLFTKKLQKVGYLAILRFRWFIWLIFYLFFFFQKLEWESLSIDLLPHPDMFMDANVACSQEGGTQRDGDGAKRAFFGGERFIEGISGEAYVSLL